MNSDKVQALKDKYAAELEAMDEKAEKLDALKRAQYDEARNNFSGFLDNLGEAAEDQWGEVTANVEKSWDELRSWWHGIGNDDESAEKGNILDDIDDSSPHN